MAEGKISGNSYCSNEIGWTITVPDGWKIVDKEKTQELTEKGVKALEKTIDGEIDFSRLKNLINFQKDQFNFFQSTSELFAIEYPGEWEENNSTLKEIIYTTYQNQGIKTDSSITGIENIDGLDFYTYSFTIYSTDGKIILKQLMYSRLINGLVFGVNINFNNKKAKDEMLSAFRNSKFDKTKIH